MYVSNLKFINLSSIFWAYKYQKLWNFFDEIMMIKYVLEGLKKFFHLKNVQKFLKGQMFNFSTCTLWIFGSDYVKESYNTILYVSHDLPTHSTMCKYMHKNVTLTFRPFYTHKVF